MNAALARSRRLLVACACLSLVHIGLFSLARSTDVVSALLSPSPASALAHLLLAVSFVAMRICVLVIVPGLVLSALVQVVLGLWARRRQARASHALRRGELVS